MSTLMEDRAIARWAILKLQADTLLVSLIADGIVYKVLPPAANTKLLPGVAVGIQSTSTPTGALRSTARQWTEQSVVLRVQVSQQTFTTELIEPVEARILDLLDGQTTQAIPGGLLYECNYLLKAPEIVEPLGMVQVITSGLWFQASAKMS